MQKDCSNLTWQFTEVGDGSASSEDGTRVKELEAREAAVAKREQEADTVNDANTVNNKKNDGREATLAEREKTASSSNESDAGEATKSKDIGQREAALAEK